MFELYNEPYEFECPPDADWLPSPYSLFEESVARECSQDRAESDPLEFAVTPDPLEIRDRCEQLNVTWSRRERELRKIRAQVALALGVCRNN